MDFFTHREVFCYCGKENRIKKELSNKSPICHCERSEAIFLA
jgi:hypothetical protein